MVDKSLNTKDAKEVSADVAQALHEQNGEVSWGPAVSIIGTIAIFLLPQIIAVTILAAAGYVDVDTLSDLPTDKTFVLYGLTELLVLGLLVVFIRLSGSSIRALGVTRNNLSQIWRAIPAYIAYLVSTFAVIAALGFFVSEATLNKEQEIGFEVGGTKEAILAFIALVIIAPIAEELLFRGFLFQGLKKKIDYRVAIAISAVLFGLAHMQLNVGVDTAVLGVFLAWLMHKTNNIAVPIALHMIKNFVAFLALFIFQVG